MEPQDTYFSFTDLSQTVLKARELAKTFAQDAADRELARELVGGQVQALADARILDVRVPVHLGGKGGSLIEVARILFEIARADPNISQAVVPHFSVLDYLLFRGSDEWRKRHAELLLSGHVFGVAAAEKGGKFVGDTKARLIETSDGLRLNGTKYYSTGSLYADFIVTVVSKDDATSLFVVLPANRQGISRTDDWNGMGQRMTASGTTVFDDVEVHPEEILAIEDFRGGRTYLGSYGQLMHAAVDAGIAAGALDSAKLAALTLGRPLPESGVDHMYDDPYAIHAMGEFATALSGSVELVERSAHILDAAAIDFNAGKSTEAQLGTASVAVAEARIATENAALLIGNGLYRLAGASATDRKHNFDRHWRNARTHTTHDPIAYKYRAVGDYYLNGRLPPNTGKN